MGRTSRRSARAASLAPGSPPPDEGVRPSDGAWEAAAMVDGELRLLGRFATEAEAWEAHDAATGTQSGAGSPKSPQPRKTPAKKPVQAPARRTTVAPARRVAAAPSLSPPPRAAPRAPQRAPRRRLPLLLALLALALAVAAALLWVQRTALLRRAPSPAAAALGAERCAASADASALAALAAGGPTWREWAAATAEELAAPRATTALSQQKADVVLLAMPLHDADDAALSAAATSYIDAAVDAAFPACAASRCRLSLRLGAGAGALRSRGALQAALVPFLRRCPGGLVVVHDVASPQAGPALPALLPLLSEAGQYEADGAAVPAVRAAVLLTARLAGLAVDAGSEEAYRRAAKGALVAALAKAGGGGEGAGNVAKAMRRRVDAVAPLRAALQGRPGIVGDATL